MGEPRHHLCFVIEAARQVLVAHVIDLGGQSLDGDLALEVGLERLVDARHAAFADQLLNLVLTEPLASQFLCCHTWSPTMRTRAAQLNLRQLYRVSSPIYTS